MGYIRNILGFLQRSYSIYSRMAIQVASILLLSLQFGSLLGFFCARIKSGRSGCTTASLCWYSHMQHSGNSTIYPDPWADPNSRSTLRFCNLHHRSTRVQNWGSTVWILPGVWVEGQRFKQAAGSKAVWTCSRSSSCRCRSVGAIEGF